MKSVITFLLRRIGGEITLPSNEFDENLILDVKMISIDELTLYHFSEKFMNIVKTNSHSQIVNIRDVKIQLAYNCHKRSAIVSSDIQEYDRAIMWNK